jgi:hypothetical protein
MMVAILLNADTKLSKYLSQLETRPNCPLRGPLQRNLLYTGVTRGKRLVVLVGQKKAVAIAVRNVFGPTALVEASRMDALGTLARSGDF